MRLATIRKDQLVTTTLNTSFMVRQWQYPMLTRVEMMAQGLCMRRRSTQVTEQWSNDAVLSGYTPTAVIESLRAPHPQRTALFQALATRAAKEEAAAVLCLWGVAPLLASFAHRRHGDIDEMIGAASFVWPCLGHLEEGADALLVAAGRIAARVKTAQRTAHRVNLHDLSHHHRHLVETANRRGTSDSAVEAAVVARVELAGLAAMLADGTITPTRWESVVEFRLSPTLRSPNATQRSHLRRVTRQLAAVGCAA